MEKNSSVPIEVIPLRRQDLRSQNIYTRDQDPKQSTEFTYCRFFVPYINNYKGWALFADDDFLWLGDIAELLDQVDDKYAIMCAQHDYAPAAGSKLAGRQQEAYPRKNWSSMVLYNCGHPANAKLTIEMINSASGSYLHRFQWIEDDALIGRIHHDWNFLVEWYTPYTDGEFPKAIHYTEGGPWFPDYRKTDYSKVWFEYLKEYEATLTQPRKLCPYERFSETGAKALEGYFNSDEHWSWSDDE